MKLRYERGALDDLDEIFAYIAADNLAAAARLVDRIEDAARRIAATPYMGEATRICNSRKHLLLKSNRSGESPAFGKKEYSLVLGGRNRRLSNSSMR